MIEYNHKPLTQIEQDVLLPILVEYFKHTSMLNPKTADKIIDFFNYKNGCFLKINNKDIQLQFRGLFTEGRLRKLCNHIRGNGILPIMSGADGYYMSKDTKEIMEMALSLRRRMAGIEYGAIGLENMARELANEKTDPLGIDWN